MPAEVSLVYNTNDKDTNIGYGKGFRLNFHQIIHKKSIAGNVYYAHTDADGTVHYFVEKEVEKDGNTVKEWKDETGLDLTLIRNLKSEEPYTIQNKDGNSMVFNESGYLIAVKDKNGNKLTVSYVNNRVKNITDGAGRIITLNYSLGSDGEEANLIQAVSPSGNKKTFAYTAGRLTTVTDIDGKKVFYTYDSNGMLASAENINGYQVKYGYYTEEPHRVKSIAEYGDGTKGKSLAMTYGYNSTKFTDNKGRKEIYRFDNNGNLLHVHDGFGHAVSCKYNVDGNHVNRLENATKLQDNVVQLLKDPVVQAENTPWTSKISPKGAGNTEINTIAAECMMGNRSLKAECTSVSGYAYWAQNVKVKKGITYTASMYVKASVSETAEDGGAILRVRYMDKDGVQQLKDSEIIKKTTEGFVRLTNTFTVPEDSSDTVVKVYMVMWHAKGVMYGDMAQLETGTSANRCNLIDNGDFHLGTTEGFEKNESNTDGLSEVGIEDNIPIKSQLLVTASSQGVLRKTPSDTGEVLSSLTKHQLLSGYITVEKNGRNWYYAKTADGKEGYVSTGQAIPYLGGHEGTNSAFVVVGNSILYKSADKTSARVQEGIDAGICAALVKTVDGTDGNKWYYMGLQIDGNRFFNRCNFPRKTFTRKPGAPSRQFRNRLIQENGCHCTARRRISNAHLTGCHQLIARRNFFFRHGDSCFKRTNGLFPCHRRAFCHIFCSIRNFIPRNLRIARHSDINRKQIRMRTAAENGCCRLLLQKIFRNCRCHFLTALRHVFFHNAIVRTERQKCSFFNRNLLFSGDSGNLDEHVLQLSEAVERLCNAVPVSLGTIHRLFRKRMDLFDCFL